MTGRVIVSECGETHKLVGSLFSFFITKNEDKTQTRLANYIYKVDRDIGEEGNIYPVPGSGYR